MKNLKRRGFVVGSLVAVLALGAISVWASPVTVVGGADTFSPNRTRLEWETSDAQTSSKDYQNVGLVGAVKHRGPLIATYTLKVAGNAPVQFKVPEGTFRPSNVRFDPSASKGADTFSFTAVLQNDDWTCSDPRLKWRSPTGEPVHLRFLNVVVDYKVTKEQPDFACR